jgi:nucleoside-diphosphate kinase
MAVERTLSIVKPDAVAKNVIGKILDVFESNGLKVAAAKLMNLSEEQAKGFYVEHAERPFYGELVEFMTSGPVLVQVLEGESAITKNRALMGATDPAEAEEGTIRKLFAESKSTNAVHGSDSPESAAREIDFFFDASEICTN